MERTVKDRLAVIEAQSFAYAVVLQKLARLATNNSDEQMRIFRKGCCDAIEELYKPPGINPGSHQTLQAVLAELEGLLSPVRREPKADEAQ